MGLEGRYQGKEEVGQGVEVSEECSAVLWEGCRGAEACQEEYQQVTKISNLIFFKSGYKPCFQVVFHYCNPTINLVLFHYCNPTINLVLFLYCNPTINLVLFHYCNPTINLVLFHYCNPIIQGCEAESGLVTAMSSYRGSTKDW